MGEGQVGWRAQGQAGMQGKADTSVSLPSTREARQLTSHKTSIGKHYLHAQHLGDLRNLLRCSGTGL